MGSNGGHRKDFEPTIEDWYRLWLPVAERDPEIISYIHNNLMRNDDLYTCEQGARDEQTHRNAHSKKRKGFCFACGRAGCGGAPLDGRAAAVAAHLTRHVRTTSRWLPRCQRASGRAVQKQESTGAARLHVQACQHFDGTWRLPGAWLARQVESGRERS